ncbi:unnamed protein product [Phytophthora fragariaefolia]|uniref:Unnamed protein product n=1 Tax=Phytophthora fragariaefolia TaxID=1490495 RepID=A0A9W6YC85_9STRA|nr:unnamed protein product [Phytophthora fragariaefolia]
MLHMSDVHEERTWSEEQEEEDEVHSLPTDGAFDQVQQELLEESTYIESVDEPTQPAGPPASLTVAHSTATNIIQHQGSNSSRLSGRDGRRMLRRLRKVVSRFFTHDLPLLRSPEMIRAMPLKARIHFYLSNPEESCLGWRLQQLLMGLLIINVCAMSSETVDGPRFGSTDPGYPYMPRDSTFNAVEGLFSLFFVFEFVVRWLCAPGQSQFWKSIPTWITLLAAIAAIPRLCLLAVGADTELADTFMYNFRILRAIRLIVLAYAYDGTKVLFQAAMNSIPPLTITVRSYELLPTKS